MGDAATFGESLGTFWNTIRNGPWGQAVNGITAAVPSSSSCPAFSFTVFGSEVSTTIHCDLMDNAGPILAVVMLAVWSLVAVRIVLSA